MATISSKVSLNDVLLSQAKEGLTRRNMTAEIVESGKEALQAVITRIEQPARVMSGGSRTVAQIGLSEWCTSEPGITYLNSAVRDIDDEVERLAFRRVALATDYVVGSANALSIDGRIVNIDSGGSRLAMYAYTANRVIMIVGVNKLCKNIDEAMHRAREWAGVRTAFESFQHGTKFAPCTVDGVCHESECFPPDRECGKMLVIEKETIPGRTHVILVNEELGF